MGISVVQIHTAALYVLCACVVENLSVNLQMINTVQYDTIWLNSPL